MGIDKPDDNGTFRESDGAPARPCAPVVVGAGRHEVTLEVRRTGRDLTVHVTGGDAHVGAVAVCWRAPGGACAEPAVTVVPRHKEGPLAVQCARTLAEAAGCTVCVVVGIHQDDITKKEIEQIVANVEAGTVLLANRLERLNP